MDQVSTPPILGNRLYGFAGNERSQSEYLGDTAIFKDPYRINLSSPFLAHYEGFRIELSDEGVMALAGKEVQIQMPGGGSLFHTVSKTATAPNMTTTLTIRCQNQ